MTTYDQNGEELHANPQLLSDGTWAALTWANGAYVPTDIGVRVYKTKEDAEFGAVSETDGPGFLGSASPAQRAEYWRLVEGKSGTGPIHTDEPVTRYAGRDLESVTGIPLSKIQEDVFTRFAIKTGYLNDIWYQAPKGEQRRLSPVRYLAWQMVRYNLGWLATGSSPQKQWRRNDDDKRIDRAQRALVKIATEVAEEMGLELAAYQGDRGVAYEVLYRDYPASNKQVIELRERLRDTLNARMLEKISRHTSLKEWDAE